jgi:hypothetical protein
VDNGLHRDLSRCHSCGWESLVLANHCGFERTRIAVFHATFSLSSSAISAVRLTNAMSLFALCASPPDKILVASTSSDTLLTHHASSELLKCLAMSAASTTLFHFRACSYFGTQISVDLFSDNFFSNDASAPWLEFCICRAEAS